MSMTENERLTIDEIIEHCNRTCENTEMLAIARGQNQEDITSKGYWEHYQVANYIEELKQYRAIGTVEELINTQIREKVLNVEVESYKEIGTIEEFKALKDKSVEAFVKWVDENYDTKLFINECEGYKDIHDYYKEFMGYSKK